MFDAIKLPAAAAAGALAGGLIIFGWAQVLAIPNARHEGKTEAEAAARQAIFHQLKERDLTNDAVRKMPDGAKCDLIGGVLANGECT